MNVDLNLLADDVPLSFPWDSILYMEDNNQQIQETPNSPTSIHPSAENYAGDFHFGIMLDDNKSGSSWNYSASLNKLFIKMENKIQLGFMFDTPACESLHVRALPVFQESNNFTKAVERCYNHKNPENKINEGFPDRASHLIWIHDPLAIYEIDDVSKRRSVRFPLGPKPNGSDRIYKAFSFMCQNSCLGMKCPIAIIFTLEDNNNVVVGRQIMNVKVCSGPNRDRKIEEEAQEKKSGKRKLEISDDGSVTCDDDFHMVKVPKKILESTVQFAKFCMHQLCEKEKRKPNKEEEDTIREYNEILKQV